jgi:hypothetical protein
MGGLQEVPPSEGQLVDGESAVESDSEILNIDQLKLEALGADDKRLIRNSLQDIARNRKQNSAFDIDREPIPRSIIGIALSLGVNVKVEKSHPNEITLIFHMRNGEVKAAAFTHSTYLDLLASIADFQDGVSRQATDQSVEAQSYAIDSVKEKLGERLISYLQRLDTLTLVDGYPWPDDLLDAFLMLTEERGRKVLLPSRDSNFKALIEDRDGEMRGVTSFETARLLKRLIDDIVPAEEASEIIDIETDKKYTNEDAEDIVEVQAAQPFVMSPEERQQADEFQETLQGGGTEVEDINTIDALELVDVSAFLDEEIVRDYKNAKTITEVELRISHDDETVDVLLAKGLTPVEVMQLEALDSEFGIVDEPNAVVILLPLLRGGMSARSGKFTLTLEGVRKLLAKVDAVLSFKEGQIAIDLGDFNNTPQSRGVEALPEGLKRFAPEDVQKMVELAEQIDGRGPMNGAYTFSFDQFAAAFQMTQREFNVFQSYYEALTFYPKWLKDAYGTDVLKAVQDRINDHSIRGESISLPQIEQDFGMSPADYGALVERLIEKGVFARPETQPATPQSASRSESTPSEKPHTYESFRDESGVPLEEAITTLLIQEPEIGISLIQRKFRVDYNAAQQALDALIAEGRLVSVDGKDWRWKWVKSAAVQGGETMPVLSDSFPASPLKYFDDRFEREFGITKEELASIPGIEHLSPAQQKLVFENFTQCTLGQVESEAAQLLKYQGERNRTELVEDYGKLLGSAVAGFKNVFQSRIGAEREVVGEFKKGGIKAHRELIGQLVASLNTFGPRMYDDPKTGELHVDFVNIQERAGGSLRGPEWEAAKALNIVAHELAKTPASWGYLSPGAQEVPGSGIFSRLTGMFRRDAQTSQEEQRYLLHENKKEKYAKAKDKLAEVFRQKGYSESQILEKMFDIDIRVHQLQTLQTDPEALARLNAVQDKNIFVEGAQRLVGKAGLGYMTLGFVGGTVLSSALGVFAAPLVASGIASLRSWNRTAAELRERDRNARLGIKDETGTALNFVDSESQREKLQRVLNKLRATPGSADKEVSALRARVEYLHDKIMLGRIQYGERATAVSRQTELLALFGEAVAYLGTCGPSFDSAIEAQTATRSEKRKELLSRVIARNEKTKGEVREAYRLNDLTTSMYKGAAFSIIGSMFGMGVRGKSAGGESGLGTWFRGTDVPVQESSPNGARPPLSQESALATPPGTVASAAESGQVAQPTATPASGAASAPSPSASAPGNIVAEAGSSKAAPAEALVGRPSALGEHIVSKGDTLTKLVSEQIPEYKDVSRAEIFKRLALLTPEELKEVGIESENINKIEVGDRVKLERLQELLESKNVYDTTANISGGGASRGVPFNPEHPDFRGPDGELNSDDLNRDRTFRMTDESGRTTVLGAGTEGSSVTGKQASILERYFLTKTIKPEYWSAVRNMTVSEFEELANFSQSSGQVPLADTSRLREVFALVRVEPLRLKPVSGEKVEAFVKRLFIEVSRQSEDAKAGPEIRKLLKLLDVKLK